MSRVARARRKGTSRVGARVTAKAGDYCDYVAVDESSNGREPFTLEPPILEFQDRRILRGKRHRAKKSTWSPFQMNREELARFNRLPVVLPPSPPESPAIPRRPAGKGVKGCALLCPEPMYNTKAQAHVGQVVLVDVDDGMGFTRGTIKKLGFSGAQVIMDASGKCNMVPYTMQQLAEPPDAVPALSEKVRDGEKSSASQGSLSFRDRANNYEKQSSIARGLGVGNGGSLVR